MIPITTVQFGPDEEALVLEVLRSGAIAQGPKVALVGLDEPSEERNGSQAEGGGHRVASRDLDEDPPGNCRFMGLYPARISLPYT